MSAALLMGSGYSAYEGVTHKADAIEAVFKDPRFQTTVRETYLGETAKPYATPENVRSQNEKAERMLWLSLGLGSASIAIGGLSVVARRTQDLKIPNTSDRGE